MTRQAQQRGGFLIRLNDKAYENSRTTSDTNAPRHDLQQAQSDSGTCIGQTRT